MESRKIVPTILCIGPQRDKDIKNRLLDTAGGEGGMI